MKIEGNTNWNCRTAGLDKLDHKLKNPLNFWDPEDAPDSWLDEEEIFSRMEHLVRPRTPRKSWRKLGRQTLNLCRRIAPGRRTWIWIDALPHGGSMPKGKGRALLGLGWVRSGSSYSGSKWSSLVVMWFTWSVMCTLSWVIWSLKAFKTASRFGSMVTLGRGEFKW